MASEIRVNKINNRAGLGTITIADTGVVVNGIVTCTEVSGLNVLNIAGVSTFASTLDINGDIDVDGHTNLDNLSVAGVSTFSDDITLTGANYGASWDKSNDHLIFSDGAKAVFGTGEDLVIRHAASQNRIISQNGATLYLKYNQSSTLENMAKFIPNGAAELYFDNALKFSTSAKGITVGTGVTIETNGQATYTGIVTASAFKLSDGSSVGGIESYAQRNTVGGTNAGDSFSGTDATDNTILGYDAGTSLTSGDRNVIIGAFAAKSLTTVSNVVAIGHSAYSSQVTSNSGTIAIGRNALKTYTGDFGQIAIGMGAGQDAGNSGGNNTLIGENAGYGCKGFSSTIVGYHAGSASNTQGGETIIGMQARYFGNNKAGNTAVGKEAMKGVSGGNGSHTTAIGYEALKILNNGGNQNTALGYQAGDKVNTGTSNVIIGYSAASTGTNDLTNGSNNIIIGKEAAATSATVSNEITLGDSNISHLRIPGIGVSFGRSGATIAGVVTATSFSGDGSSLSNLPAGAPVGGASTNTVFFENDVAVAVNYQVTSNKNAMSAGPIAINAGIAVTVPSGSSWTIV